MFIEKNVSGIRFNKLKVKIYYFKVESGERKEKNI